MVSTLLLVRLSITDMRLPPIPCTFFLCLASLTACSAEPENEGACLEIALTGTQGGPPAVSGLAGAGTLIRYGDVSNDCSEVILQFDTGRGTLGRLSQLGVSALQLDAVFLTHVHSDHTEGLAALLQYRWHFLGGPLDIVCSADATASDPPPARTLSCSGLVAHTADAMIRAGEIAQRYAENHDRDPAGPAALVRLQQIPRVQPGPRGNVVWQSGDVSVSAIGTTHIPGSNAYRVDTPAGSVVIGGDAGNSKLSPPRSSSTSETVERLAGGADVLVHSVIHPVFAPAGGSTFPAAVYYRQSNAADLGALAKRAGVQQLILTHLIPALQTDWHGPYAIPGGVLNKGDFESAVRQGGFNGKVHVGTDLLTVRLPGAE